MNDHYDVLIVGGGHGGAQTAIGLRQRGFTGTLAIVGEEPDLPYERPPLSKDYLAGAKPWERMPFRTAEGWAERGVDLRLGRRVVSVDADAHQVTAEDGVRIGYGTLVWAAGGIARRLPGTKPNLAGIHTVRTRADVDRMIAELPAVAEVVVVGGGYIGLEAAAVLRTLGKNVTLLEASGRVLVRVAGEALSRFYEEEHRARGVDLRLGAAVETVLAQEGRVAGVRLAGGEVVPAQMVILGIGIDAAVAPLAAAGAECGNGARVDEQCRTSLPDVFAVGDCAEHRNPYAAGAWVRLESVQNAHDQAAVVAGAILGGSGRYEAVPWFWSNQYDLRLQTVGLSLGHDDFVLRGSPDSRSFSVVYLREGRVIALDCVNLVRDYAQGRALVTAGARPDRALLADPTVPLKSLVGG